MSDRYGRLARLNLSFLIVLRETIIEEGPAEAALRFGVSQEEAARVAALEPDELQDLASGDLLMFTPRALFTALLAGNKTPAVLGPALLRTLTEATPA